MTEENPEIPEVVDTPEFKARREAEAKAKQEMIDWIDKATVEQLLRKWRFGITGDPYFQGEVGEHFARVMAEKQNNNRDEWVAASKAIGWGK